MAPDVSTLQTDDHFITSLDALEEIYGESPSGALKKEIDYISEQYRAFIEAAPFVSSRRRGPRASTARRAAIPRALFAWSTATPS